MDHPERLLDNPPASAPVDRPEHWRRFAPDLSEDTVLFSEPQVDAGLDYIRQVRAWLEESGLRRSVKGTELDRLDAQRRRQRIGARLRAWWRALRRSGQPPS